jgi:hypothetical protein
MVLVRGTESLFAEFVGALERTSEIPDYSCTQSNSKHNNSFYCFCILLCIKGF